MNSLLRSGNGIQIVLFVLLALAALASPEKSCFCQEKQSEDAIVKPADIATDDYSELDKKIIKTVKDWEYTEEVARNFAAMAKPWKCDEMAKKLSDATEELKADKITRDQYAAIEKKIVEQLAGAIKKTISGVDTNIPQNGKYFSLPFVIQDKKAQCVGFSQVFFALGNSIGLTVHGLQVIEHSQMSMPPNMGHVACEVCLRNDKRIQVDLTLKRCVSEEFSLEDKYAKEGVYWKLKEKNSSNLLHPCIQDLDEKGFYASLCCNRGIAISKTGQIDKAMAIFSKAVELHPQNAEVYLNRGKIYFETGKPAEAVADANKALELNPRLPGAYVNRSSAYGMMGKTEESLADCNKAIEMDPRYSEAFNNRGIIELKQGNKTDALTDFAKAIEINPNYAGAYVNRGNVYSMSGEWNDALTAFDKAIELNPRYVQAYIMRGMAYIKSEKKEAAAKDFQKAMELNPKMKEQIQKMAERLEVPL